METAELIQEYNIKKQHVKDLRKILNDKEGMIFFSVDYNESASFYTGKCIVQYVSMEPPVYDDYPRVYQERKRCNNFGKCNLPACRGYNNYINYVNAKKDYENAKQELKKYPYWIRFCSIFCR